MDMGSQYRVEGSNHQRNAVFLIKGIIGNPFEILLSAPTTFNAIIEIVGSQTQGQRSRYFKDMPKWTVEKSRDSSLTMHGVIAWLPFHRYSVDSRTVVSQTSRSLRGRRFRVARYGIPAG